jgi:hypothetical protein
LPALGNALSRRQHPATQRLNGRLPAGVRHLPPLEVQVEVAALVESGQMLANYCGIHRGQRLPELFGSRGHLLLSFRLASDEPFQLGLAPKQPGQPIQVGIAQFQIRHQQIHLSDGRRLGIDTHASPDKREQSGAFLRLDRCRILLAFPGKLPDVV